MLGQLGAQCRAQRLEVGDRGGVPVTGVRVVRETGEPRRQHGHGVGPADVGQAERDPVGTQPRDPPGVHEGHRGGGRHRGQVPAEQVRRRDGVRHVADRPRRDECAHVPVHPGEQCVECVGSLQVGRRRPAGLLRGDVGPHREPLVAGSAAMLSCNGRRPAGPAGSVPGAAAVTTAPRRAGPCPRRRGCHRRVRASTDPADRRAGPDVAARVASAGAWWSPVEGRPHAHVPARRSGREHG